MEKTQDCDMCIEKAVLFCVATGNKLCWECDESSLWQEYNITRHSRYVLCRLCRLVTPWQPSHLEGSRTLPVCDSCRVRICRARRMKLKEKDPQFLRAPPRESTSSEEQRRSESNPGESSSSLLLSNQATGGREDSEKKPEVEEASYCSSEGSVQSSMVRKRPASPSSHSGESPRRQKVVRNAAEEEGDRPAAAPVPEPAATKVRPSSRRRIDIRVYRSLLRVFRGEAQRQSEREREMAKTRDCDICIEKAVLFCVATGNKLCWECDQSSLWQVYNITRHARILFCRLCGLVTPWQVSDLEGSRTQPVCHSCRVRVCRARRMKPKKKDPRYLRAPSIPRSSSSEEKHHSGSDREHSSLVHPGRTTRENKKFAEEESYSCSSERSVNSSPIRKRPASPTLNSGGSPRRPKIVRRSSHELKGSPGAECRARQKRSG